MDVRPFDCVRHYDTYRPFGRFSRDFLTIASKRAKRSGTGAMPLTARDFMKLEISEDSPRLEQIYFHASRLFLEKGFAATSMSEIAESVGITKASLYHFISSKEDLLFTLMNWGLDILDQDVRQQAEGIEDPLDRLTVIVRNHLLNIARVATDHGNPFTVIMDEPAGLGPEKASHIRTRKREYFELVRSCMVELKRDGRLADLDPSVAAFGVLGTILWFGRWHRPNGPTEDDVLVSQLTGMCLRAALKPDVSVAVDGS